MFKSRTQWQELKPVPKHHHDHFGIFLRHSSQAWLPAQCVPRNVLGLQTSGPRPRPTETECQEQRAPGTYKEHPKALRQRAVQGLVLQAPASAGASLSVLG